MPPCATLNETPLLATPPTVTTTFPVVAPLGTTALIEVGVQLEMVVAGVPLNVTVLGVEPKFAPVIVTDVPTFPEVGDRLVMLGDAANSVPVKPAPTITRISSCRIVRAISLRFVCILTSIKDESLTKLLLLFLRMRRLKILHYGEEAVGQFALGSLSTFLASARRARARFA